MEQGTISKQEEPQVALTISHYTVHLGLQSEGEC